MKTKTVIIAAVAAVMCAGSALARPHGGPGGHRGGPPPRMHQSGHFGGRGFAPPPPRYHGGHHHHHSGWGHGGRGFVGGVVGGLVGGLVYNAVTAPTRFTDAIVTGTHSRRKPRAGSSLFDAWILQGTQHLGPRMLCGPGPAQRRGSPRLGPRPLRGTSGILLIPDAPESAAQPAHLSACAPFPSIAPKSFSASSSG